jgi:hypothetical protein
MTDQKKDTSGFGVISPAMAIERDEGNMLMTLRVDSVNAIGDLDTDEFKMAIVSSMFKKVLHPDFRPALISELQDRIKFYVIMEIPEGLIEDTVLAGLCDRPNGVLFQYNTKKTEGLSQFVPQFKIKGEEDGQ